MTPAEKKRNKAVPVRKALPAKTAPVILIEDYEYNKVTMSELMRLCRRLMRDNVSYTVSLKIQENEA